MGRKFRSRDERHDLKATLARRMGRVFTPPPANPLTVASVEVLDGASPVTTLSLTAPSAPLVVNSIELLDGASPVTVLSLTAPSAPGGSDDTELPIVVTRLASGSGSTLVTAGIPLPEIGAGMTLTPADVANLGVFNEAGVEVARYATDHIAARPDGTLPVVLVQFNAGTMASGATKTYTLRKAGRTLAPVASYTNFDPYTATPAGYWGDRGYPAGFAYPSVEVMRKARAVSGFILPTKAQVTAAGYGAIDTALEDGSDAWWDHTINFPDGLSGAEYSVSRWHMGDATWIAAGEGNFLTSIYTQMGYYAGAANQLYHFVRTGDVKWLKRGCAYGWMQIGSKVKAIDDNGIGPSGWAEPFMGWESAYTYYVLTGHPSAHKFLRYARDQLFVNGTSARYNNANYANDVGLNVHRGVTSMRENTRTYQAMLFAFKAKAPSVFYADTYDMLATCQIHRERCRVPGNTSADQKHLMNTANGYIPFDILCNDTVPGNLHDDGGLVNSFQQGIYTQALLETMRWVSLDSAETAEIRTYIDQSYGHLLANRFINWPDRVGFSNGYGLTCSESNDQSTDIPVLNFMHIAAMKDMANRGNTSAASAISAILTFMSASGGSYTRSRLRGNAHKEYNELFTYWPIAAAMTLGEA